MRATTNAVNFDRHYSAVGIPLDDCVSGPVTLIKIDVEGFEMSALRGLKETIQRDLPFLFIECLSADALDETSEFLASMSYRQHGEPFHSTMYEFRPISSLESPAE